MLMTTSRPRLWVLLVAIASFALSGLATAEPPSRAARLSYIKGTVSFSPAGQPDWVQAVVNRPLTTGDALWTDEDSRAELQLGGAAIRLGSTTSVTLLNLDDHIAQMQLSQGTLKVRVRRLGKNQVFEVDTPNLAFTLSRAGEYRIDVDPHGDATVVRVQSGEAEVYGEGSSYTVDSRQGYRFYGTGLSDYETLAARHDDDLDTWARERDSRSDFSPSARYVSPDVVGYEDLDASGNWRDDPDYGNVWTPTHVAAGWTPYHDGHWAWIDPWGWTWVDDAPWGFAVSHYGRWANIKGSWGWVPGPPREQAVYAPALVAFVGGKDFQGSLSVGNTVAAVAAVVGWFPLAPREVFRPSYPVSRGYFDNINRSNAVIAPATITKVYNTTNITNNTTIINKTTNVNVTKVVYVNQQVVGAVVAVPSKVFVQSQPVAKASIAISKEAATSAPVGNVAVVAPVPQSVHGGAATAGSKPPIHERAVVAHTAPPPPPVAFAVQQQRLAAKPGMPINDGQRKELKPVAAPGPKVGIVAAVQAATPTAPPPATPPAGKSPEARKADAAKIDAARADSTKGETIKTDPTKAEAAKPDAAKADPAKVDAAKVDTVKGDAVKAEATKAESAKAETAKADTAKAEASKAEVLKAEAAKADTAKAEASKAEALKAEAGKAATAKADAAKADVAKAEASKAEALKAEATKAATAKAETAKADTAKADASKAEALKAEAAKAATAKAEAAKADAAKAEASKAEALKAEASKAATAKAEAAKADAAKAEASKAEEVNAEAAKAATAKAEAAKADAAKAEASKAEAVNAEAAKAATAKAEPAKANAAKAAKAKADALLKAEGKCDSAQTNCPPK